MIGVGSGVLKSRPRSEIPGNHLLANLVPFEGQMKLAAKIDPFHVASFYCTFVDAWWLYGRRIVKRDFFPDSRSRGLAACK